MKKSSGMIIWIIALAVLLAAAYTFYEKNNAGFIASPPQLGQQQTGNDDVSREPGNKQEADPSAADDSLSADDSTTADDAGDAQSKKILAPDFTLKDLEGNEVSLSDYEGKIVLLNFWAVWCKYCVAEMPDLNKLNKELDEAGDAVILAVDVQEPHDTVNDFLKKKEIDLKVLMDEDGSVAWTYGVEGYPTTFIINADRSVYTYIPGASNYETFRKLVDMARNGEPLK